MSVRILHIDCSGPKALLLYAEDGIPKGSSSSMTARDHAANLNVMVDALMAEAGCNLEEMDAFAVCGGPGSYTGLRIGLAAAKGFCYALEKPLLMDNRLSLMLEELEAQADFAAKNRMAILPARAGEYYVSAQGEWETKPTHIMEDELIRNAQLWTIPALLIGQLEKDFHIPNVKQVLFHEELNLSTWAQRTFKSFLSKEFRDLAYIIPEYLKAAYVSASKREK